MPIDMNVAGHKMIGEFRVIDFSKKAEHQNRFAKLFCLREIVHEKKIDNL